MKRNILYGFLFFLQIVVGEYAFGQTIGFYENFDTKLQNEVKQVAISRSGKYIAISTNNEVAFHDIATQKQLKRIKFTNPQEIASVHFSNNDSIVVISFQNYTTLLFNRPNKESFIYNWFTETKVSKSLWNIDILYSKSQSESTMYIFANAYFKFKTKGSPDSTKAPSEAAIITRHRDDQSLNAQFGRKYIEILDQVVCRNERYLAISTQDYILILNPKTLDVVDSIPGISNINPALNLCFSPDGNYLACRFMNEAVVRVYDLAKKTFVFDYKDIENSEIKSIAINDSLIAISTLRLLNIYNYHSKNKVFTENPNMFHNDAINHISSMVFVPNSDLLIFGGYNLIFGENGTLYPPRAIIFDFKEYKRLIESTDASEELVSRNIGENTFVNTQQWHSDAIDFPVFKSTNNFITVSNNDIFVWEKRTIRRINNFHFSDEIEQLAYCSDGKYIIVKTHGNSNLRIVDALQNTMLILSKTDDYNFEYSSVDFMSVSGSSYLFTYSNYGDCHIFNLKDSVFEKNYTIDFQISYMSPQSVQINDKSYNVILSEDNKILLHNPFDSSILFSKKLGDKLSLISVSKNEIYLGLISGDILRFNPQTMSFDKLYKVDALKAFFAIESIAADQLFIGYEDKKDENVQSLIQWKSKTKKELNAEDYINEVGLINSKVYYVADYETIRFMDLNSNREIKKISRLKGNNSEVNLERIALRANLISLPYTMVDLRMAEVKNTYDFSQRYFFKDSNYVKEIRLNLYSDDEKVGLAIVDYDDRTLQEIVINKKKNELIDLDGTIISNNNRYAATYSFFGGLQVWDMQNYKLLKRIKTHKNRCLSWNYKGDKLLVVDQDQSNLKEYLRIYSAENNKVTDYKSLNVNLLYQLCFSPNDSVILVGYNSVFRYNLITKKFDKDYFYHPSYVTKMMYYEPKDLLIVGLENGEIFVWSYADSKLLYRLWKHSDAIIGLSVDGQYLVSSSKDQSVNIWDLDRGELEATYFQFIENKETKYCFLTSDNYYKSSKDISSFMHFVDHDKAYPLEQFDLKYNRPDIILNRLGYADSSLITAYHQAYLKRLKKMNFTEDMLKDDFHLPEIKIENFEEMPTITDSSSVGLNLQLNDSKYKLDRINVWVNNVAIYGTNGISLRDKNVQEYNTNLRVNLVKGNNKVQVSVLNQAGVESYKETFEIECKAGKSKPNLYLITIGESKFKDSNYNLTYAAKDAHDIASLFSQSEVYGKVFTKTLTNEQVTKENIEALRSFLDQADINDEVMIFIAGHGVLDKDLDYFFASYDMDFNNPSQRGIAYEDLEGLLDGIKPLKKVLLIDACHSGEIDKEEVELLATAEVHEGDIQFRAVGNSVKPKLGMQNTSELTKQLFTDLRKGTGATVISSAGGGEYAMESGEWKNGLFTYCLINGIQTQAADLNDDGEIWLKELQEYVQTQVSELSGGKQQPTSRIENSVLDYRVW